MKNIYIVYTPYQLMAALNIVLSSEKAIERHVIVLVHPNLEQYAAVIRKDLSITVYSEERLYREYGQKSPFKAHLEMVSAITRTKSIVKSIDYLNEPYEWIFAPSDEIICQVVYAHLRKKGAKLALFDDGVGTYDLYTYRKIRLIGRIVYRILLNSIFAKQISKIYVYRPELLDTPPEGVTVELIDYKSKTNILFKEHASSMIDCYKNRKVIFLDQGFSSVNVVIKCLDYLKEIYPKDAIIIKKHPRIQNSIYNGFDTVNDGLPFEAIAACLNLEDYLIVSFSSGASVTPFLLNNQRPRVILMLNLYVRSEQEARAQHFFEKVKKIYKNLMMPNSLGELECMIKKSIEYYE